MGRRKRRRKNKKPVNEYFGFELCLRGDSIKEIRDKVEEMVHCGTVHSNLEVVSKLDWENKPKHKSMVPKSRRK